MRDVINFIGRAFMFVCVLGIASLWLSNAYGIVVLQIKEDRRRKQQLAANRAAYNKELAKRRYDAEKRTQLSYIDQSGKVNVEVAKKVLESKQRVPNVIEFEIK